MKFQVFKSETLKKSCPPPPWCWNPRRQVPAYRPKYYSYLNTYKYYNPLLNWSTMICRSIEYKFFLIFFFIITESSIYFTHHLFKNGSRRLKLFNVCAIPATIWSLGFSLSESVKIVLLRPALKVLVLIVWWLCFIGIWDKVYLSL